MQIIDQVDTWSHYIKLWWFPAYGEIGFRIQWNKAREASPGYYRQPLHIWARQLEAIYAEYFSCGF